MRECLCPGAATAVGAAIEGVWHRTGTNPACPTHGRQPDRPELLTISVGELAWVLTGWIDKTELRQGERIIQSPKKEQIAAESMFAKIKEMRTHFAEIQRQRDTLQGDGK